MNTAKIMIWFLLTPSFEPQKIACFFLFYFLYCIYKAFFLVENLPLFTSVILYKEKKNSIQTSLLFVHE